MVIIVWIMYWVVDVVVFLDGDFIVFLVGWLVKFLDGDFVGLEEEEFGLELVVFVMGKVVGVRLFWFVRK